MFSKIFSRSEATDVAWNHLTNVDQLNHLDEASKIKPVLIFKHSTRCSISAMSLGRFERSYNEAAAFDSYFLDLIANRELSNTIADRYGVRHESPQAILIKGGQAIYDASHTAISFDQINDIAAQH